MSKLGTKIKLIQPSKHAGCKGLVVRDYDSMLIIKVDDEHYPGCWKRYSDDRKTKLEGKYLQVRADCSIQTK